MKRFILTCFISVCILQVTVSVKAQNIVFESNAFKQAILDNYSSIDQNTDGEISQSEAALYYGTLDVSSEGITDLTGIEYFTNVTILKCYGNELESLDVSENINLESLSCYANDLESLDVSKNTKLTSLTCHANNLTYLNVSCGSLTFLFCGTNDLIQLDVSSNSDLKTLSCNGNDLENLDVSKNTYLESLNCLGNELKSLILSQNINLKSLSCGSNQLTQLDVSSNTNLETLSCYMNEISTLNLNTNTSLTSLNCSDNQLNTLDLSIHDKLNSMQCYGNQLTSLKLNANAPLQTFQIANNKFPFSALQEIKTALNSQPSYYTSKSIFLPLEGASGFEVDYTTELSFEGNDTEFHWYDENGNEVNETYVEREGTTGIFRFLQLGTYYCEMSNANFPNLTLQTDNITIKSVQNITFEPQTSFKVNDTYTLSASSDSSLPIRYEVDEEDQEKVSISDNIISFLQEGEVTIHAIQDGNDEYESAQVSVTVSVSKRTQNITFEPQTSFKVNDTYTLSASSDSSLETFRYEVGEEDQEKVSISNHIISFQQEGQVTIHAIQDGNYEYESAQVSATVSVSKKEQSIVFDNLPDEVRVNDVIELSASASSGLEIQFLPVEGNVDINGNTITFNAEGTVRIMAVQDGNYEFLPAEEMLEFDVLELLTHVENELSQTTVSIYPNPVWDQLYVQFENNNPKQVHLYDLNGKLLLQDEAFSSKNIKMTHLPEGIYLLKILLGKKELTYKISKK